MARNHPGTDRWRSTIGRKLGANIEFTQARVGQTLHIPCAHGEGHIVDFEITKMMPPEAVTRKMLHMGWSIGSKLVCPDHTRQPKKANGACGTQAPPKQEDAVIASEARVQLCVDGKRRGLSPGRLGAEAEAARDNVVREALRQSGGLTIPEIEALTSINRGSIQNIMLRFLTKGEVTRTRAHGRDPYKYSLADAQQPPEQPKEKPMSKTAPPGVTTAKIIEQLTQMSDLTIYDLAELVMLRPKSIQKQMETLFAQGVVTRALAAADHRGHRSYLYSLKTGGGTQPKPQPKKDPVMATSATAPAISEEARVARRLAHALIEEQYDETTGCYRNGYTDQKVANETGAGLAFVTQRRETEFGPLKMPSEFPEIMAKLDAFGGRIEEFAAQMVRENDARTKGIADLREGLATLRREITVTMRKHGWA